MVKRGPIIFVKSKRKNQTLEHAEELSKALIKKKRRASEHPQWRAGFSGN